MKRSRPLVLIVVAGLFIAAGAWAFRNLYILSVDGWTTTLYRDGLPYKVYETHLVESSDHRRHALSMLDPLNVFLTPIGIGLLRLRESSRRWAIGMVWLQGLGPLFYLAMVMLPVFGVRWRRIDDGVDLSELARSVSVVVPVSAFALLLVWIGYVLTCSSVKAAFKHARDVGL